jgi:hypothetical protein
MSISSGDDGLVRHLIDVRAFHESTFLPFFLLSPLGERLGEGVIQKVVFVLHPLT